MIFEMKAADRPPGLALYETSSKFLLRSDWTLAVSGDPRVQDVIEKQVISRKKNGIERCRTKRFRQPFEF